MSLISTLRMYTRRTKQLDQPTDLYERSVRLLDGGALDLQTLRALLDQGHARGSADR